MARRPNRFTSLDASIAAHTRWAREPDRHAATQPARDGLEARFAREVDPEGVLDPAERERRVQNARSAHFKRLAKKSATTRATNARVRRPVDGAESPAKV